MNLWLRRAVATIPFLALVLSHVGFAPIYDGAVYGECVFEATEHGFNVWALNCSGHPSMSYMSLVAAAYKLGGGRYWPIVVVNAALGAFAIVALLSILDRLYPERPAWERLLVATVFGVVPPFVAGAVNLSVDYGTVVFFVLFLAALVRDRPLEAAGAGLFLAFTKEPGAFLSGLGAAAYLAFFVVLTDRPWPQKRRRLVAWLPLVAVPVAFAAYLAARHFKHENLVWSAGHVSLVHDFLSFSFTDRVFQSFLASTFVINFMWLPTLVVVAGFVGWIVRRLRRSPAREGASRARAGFVATLLVVSTWALTRHDTYVNVRYFLPLFPLLVWSAFHVVAGLDTRARGGLFALMLGLFLISCVRTADPVAKAVYGTFAFGDHPMLKVTSYTGECCGYGRDQIVYDLEFTHLDTLLNEALAEIHPTAEAPLVMASRAHWYELQAVAPGPPMHRVAPRADARPAPVVLVWQLLASPHPPPVVYFVDFPNVDGTRDLRALAQRYSLFGAREFDDAGYKLHVLVLHRR